VSKSWNRAEIWVGLIVVAVGGLITAILGLFMYAGSSVFLSTPSDLVRFGMAINGGKLLQPAMVQLLQASQQLPSGRPVTVWLGPETAELSEQRARSATPGTHWAGWWRLS
jgi:hypothetical protein